MAAAGVADDADVLGVDEAREDVVRLGARGGHQVDGVEDGVDVALPAVDVHLAAEQGEQVA